MTLCVILLILTLQPLSVFLPVTAANQFVYSFTELVDCSDSVNETTLLFSLNENEIVFEDYDTLQIVTRMPTFSDPIDFHNIMDFEDFAISVRDKCIQTIKNITKVTGKPTEPKVPPDCNIYPKHYVLPGGNNTIVCFITNFYPPHIKLWWMKNDVRVTDGVYFSQIYINTDGTFNIFSTLNTTTNTGDTYSCAVDHPGFNSPQSISWDESMQIPLIPPSVTPTVVFAVGIAVGILGLATGIFFVIKGTCFH